MMDLTPKQRLFVEAYVSNGCNATKAALAAGYSPRCARQQGSENLAKQAVIKALKKRMPNLIGRAVQSSQQQRPASIYVIVAPAVGRYKIGLTRRHVADRLCTLRVASPIALEVVTSFPGDARVERALHERFADRHSHGEWFELTPEDLEWLRGYGDERSANAKTTALRRRVPD